MAGSWGSATIGNGTFNDVKFKTISVEGTGDSTDGSFPTLTVTSLDGLTNMSGLLLGVRVVFDGTATPSEIDIKVTDADGVDLLGGAASGATNKFTDTGKVSLSPAEPFTKSLYIVIATAATNANASDKATVILYVLD